MSTVLAAPFSTHFLADHGADVIKIESPEGDITRRVGASPVPDMASIFQHINRGKRSVQLDLKSPEGASALRSLLEDADALVYNARPEAMRRLGFDADTVRVINPRLVYCGVTGFGSGGRYAGKAAYDDLIQGLCAIPDLAARGSGDPRFAPMALADRVVGLYAAVGLLAALNHSLRTGEGSSLEIPMFECMAHFVLVEHMFQRSFCPDGKLGNDRALDANRRPYQTLDGMICVLPYNDRHWRDIFGLIDRPELRADPRFATFTGRLDHIGELYGSVASALRLRTTAHWLAVFEAADIPAMPMNSLEALIADPHLADVGFFHTVDDGHGRPFTGMRPGIVWNDRPASSIGKAPELGQHTVEVMNEYRAGARAGAPLR